MTKLIPIAATRTFGRNEATAAAANDRAAAELGAFRYAKQIIADNQAVLEFENKIHGKYINGVDILECNDESKRLEFRVLLRPLQTVSTTHPQMSATPKKMQTA